MHMTSHSRMRTLPLQRSWEEGCVRIPRQRPARSNERRKAIQESLGWR